MAIDGNLLPRYLLMQKSLLSSLRLKDVLDSAVVQFAELGGNAKVAIFLSDNESLALKLMAARGYSQASLDQLKILPFSTESLLKYVVQKRAAVTAANPQGAPDVSRAVMQREGSAGQIGLPLISSNLLVGAILIDVTNAAALNFVDFLSEVADVSALTIANSILYGRSEYERERLSTLYKTSCALSNSAMQAGDVLQVAADTSVVLGNSPNCAILLYDGANSVFQMATYKGLEGNSLKDFDLSVRDTIAGSCLRSGKTEYIGEGGREPFGLPRASGGAQFQSVIALPLFYQQQPLGVIEVFSTEARAFHREQIDLLESLAGQVSSALKVALTHESAAANSIIDVHTGLYNRVHFDDSVHKEIERSTRHQHELSVLIVDIDHLGQMNEMLGQEKGDDAIRYVARTVKSSLRDIDISCRIGGEEFGVILPETNASSAIDVAERLRKKIRSETVPGIGVIAVSIGVASYPTSAESAEQLVKAASEALDVAKYEGRDRVKEAETGRIAASGPIAWDELARQAKLSVINERQANQQSRLTVAPEYAGWLTKTPNLVKKKGSDSN
jgi:diguanylate cyclase (GGDEF)-like protein